MAHQSDEASSAIVNIAGEQVETLNASDVSLAKLGEFVGAGAMHGCGMDGLSSDVTARGNRLLRAGSVVGAMYPCGISSEVFPAEDGSASVLFYCARLACHSPGTSIRSAQRLQERVRLIQKMIDQKPGQASTTEG